MERTYWAFGKLTGEMSLDEVIERSGYIGAGTIWEAKLSTGKLERFDLESDSVAKNEVILGIGEEGLKYLMEFGFVFSDAQNAREMVPDARQISWERLLPLIGEAPSQLYLPSGLKLKDLIKLSQRFEAIGFKLPTTGYLDEDTRCFVEYKIEEMIESMSDRYLLMAMNMRSRG